MCSNSMEQQECVSWKTHRDLCLVSPDEDKDLILSAARSGDVWKLRNILTAKETPSRDLLRGDADGWTVLHEASYYGRAECVTLLLTVAPELINTRTRKHQTPLILAVSREHLSCVELLLEKGADPGVPTVTNETALYEACARRSAQTARLLLRNGADVHQKCLEGWAALHEAVSQNHLELCEVLVEHGAEINSPNIYGVTPLFLAAQCGHLDPLRFLVALGADVNREATDGATALYEACRKQHMAAAELLLSHSADANTPGKDGLLPLHLAAKHGDQGIISKLIPITSASVIFRSGISPLHLSAESSEDEALELLIHAGFDVNILLTPERSCMYEDRRRSALYFAVDNRNPEAARMLLDAGANPNLDPFNVLLLAVRQGDVQMARLLLEHGADINAALPTHLCTFPACVMLSVRNITMMKCLMDHGCDAEACFRCEHAAQELRTHAGSETETQLSMQFCEMISARSVSHCSGAVVNLLLDYSAGAKLCFTLQTLLEREETWTHIRDKAAPPATLLQLCRLRIRRLAGFHRLTSIQKLPERLMRFLKHQQEENLL